MIETALLASALLLGTPEAAPPVVAEIRAEVLRPNDGPAGRPLPLAANWNVNNWGPDYQVRMVRAGHHVLPWIGHPHTEHVSSEKGTARWWAQNEAAVRLWAAWKMPLTIRDHNYAMALARKPYNQLPAEKNPCTIRPDGSVLKRPSPLGPVGPWREVGRHLVSNGVFARLAEIYPDPPWVQFLSNNETRLLRWHELGESARYLERHGRGRDGAYKRKVVADGWVERFGALLGAMRDALPTPAWRGAARFTGYNAFGPACYGRWGGWKAYAIPIPGRIDPHPLFWDGGSPSYYDNNWEPAKADYRVWSCQTEAMNWVPMLQEAYRLNPDFWFEMSVWDGDQGKKDVKASKPYRYEQRGESWTPGRYEGSMQFGLWLVRPRAVREFRGSVQPREKYQPYWDAILRAVDRVWSDETLVRFWRGGRLVANPAREHPWQANPVPDVRDEPRWFRLDTSLDPAGEWGNGTKLTVWPLARVLGEKPRREWLVYAHAPLGEQRGVRVRIPGGPEITIDIPVAGAFHRVDEKSGAVTKVASD